MDENTQPPIQQPTPDPNAQPQSFTPVVAPKNKLEELPPEIRVELDASLKRDGNVNKAKTALEKKWLGQTDILPASYSTYKAYFELHRLRLFKEREEEVKALQKVRQDLEGYQEMAVDIAKGNPVSFRDKHQEMLEFIDDRIASVVEQQSHGWASPQYEAVMNQWVKTKREVLEKMEEYKDKIDEERHAKNVAFFDRFAQELLKCVLDCYRKVNGETNIAEFKAELTSEVVKIAERTAVDYDREINDL